MRLSIRAKLFATLLVATATIVVGMLSFVRWSFERGFVELVETREAERLEALAERLGAVHDADGGWEALRRDRRRWVRLLVDDDRRRRRWHPRPRRGKPGAARDDNHWPPDRPPRLAGGRPPPLELRVMLLDDGGEIVFGRQDLLARGARRLPIVTAAGTVGALAVLPGPALSEQWEVRFLERQRSATWIIALLMVALSGGLAMLLASRLVRPLRAFQDAARSLAGGDFAARVRIEGDDELARLGRDLNALAEALERNERDRRQWVADISHELRTPLSVLRAELEALQDGVRPMSRGVVDSLYGDALRLGRLVDDLYELSMTDIGALSYRWVDVDPVTVLAMDVEALGPEFERAGLSVAFDDRTAVAPTMRADPQRLSQLFRNVLGNSARYTDPGGRVEVAAALEDGALTLDVRDSPPGVPDAALPRLFDRLYRVEGSRSRDSGGTGLGLAICANIAAAHGGEMSARASPLGGLWVRITLPLVAA